MECMVTKYNSDVANSDNQAKELESQAAQLVKLDANLTKLNEILTQLKSKVAVDSSIEEKVLNNLVFVCTTNDLTSGATGGAETPRLLISNPTGSGKKMKIFLMTLGTNISTNNNILRLYRNPVITANGTPLVPQNFHLAASVPVSSMQLFSVPTASNNGNLMLNYIAGPTSTNPIDFQHKMIIEEGQKLLIAVRPNTTAVTYSINVYWVEEP